MRGMFKLLSFLRFSNLYHELRFNNRYCNSLGDDQWYIYMTTREYVVYIWRMSSKCHALS